MVYLYDMIGAVSEVVLPNKCTVEFWYEYTVEKALLVYDRLIVEGRKVDPGKMINEYLKEGSLIRFSCHEFDRATDGKYGWYIINAWRKHTMDSMARIYGTFLGFYNCVGKVTIVANRQGVITYVDNDGREHSILFLGSKVFFFGKRLGTKHNLRMILSEEDNIAFDAVPCLPNENEYHCSWFASVVWKGKKPSMEYDNQFPDSDQRVRVYTLYKSICTNPKYLFFSGKGFVMRIVNAEYGLALVTIKSNIWQSVVFHRSVVFLFKAAVSSSTSLMDLLQEGDRLCIVAAAAPNVILTQWIATHVGIDVGDEIELPDF